MIVFSHIAGLLILVLPVLMLEGQPGPTDPASVEPDVGRAPPGNEQTDPTRPGAELQQYMMQAQSQNRQRVSLPRMQRRAYLAVEGHAPEALIEIDDVGLFTVHSGATVSFVAHDGILLTFHVAQLSADEIRIEIPNTGEKLVLR